MSAVLEFNYLKAPIGFFLLFVLPALLIGIAPSIVVDYGRLVAHTATAGESAIVLPVISLALIAIAWWIGRLLFEIAWENFWQLHYSLVLPVFVVLRELLRAMLEKFRGRAVTAEQLDHGRRVCAVIAALIFAGGGLAVAVSVDVSFGWKLVDVIHLRWRPVVFAALCNAAVILGISAALESLFWIWRELSLKDTVRDWVPGSADADALLSASPTYPICISSESATVIAWRPGPMGRAAIGSSAPHCASLARYIALARLIAC